MTALAISQAHACSIRVQLLAEAKTIGMVKASNGLMEPMYHHRIRCDSKCWTVRSSS